MFARPRCADRTYQMCPSSSRRIAGSMFMRLTTPAGPAPSRLDHGEEERVGRRGVRGEPRAHLVEAVEGPVGHVGPDRLVLGRRVRAFVQGDRVRVGVERLEPHEPALDGCRRRSPRRARPRPARRRAAHARRSSRRHPQRAEPLGRLAERLQRIEQRLHRPDEPLEPPEVGCVLAQTTGATERLVDAGRARRPRFLGLGAPPRRASRGSRARGGRRTPRGRRAAGARACVSWASPR